MKKLYEITSTEVIEVNPEDLYLQNGDGEHEAYRFNPNEPLFVAYCPLGALALCNAYRSGELTHRPITLGKYTVMAIGEPEHLEDVN